MVCSVWRSIRSWLNNTSVLDALAAQQVLGQARAHPSTAPPNVPLLNTCPLLSERPRVTPYEIEFLVQCMWRLKRYAAEMLERFGTI